ncbi:uncharacterized protein [Primulina huaijiensis]|uniref:uncharacterized protein isoform X4 n=1 Tax=Primulina huaijiensis TaxID=1492673 RepID=UPI003CC75FCC
MGKSDNELLPVVQQHTHGGASPTSICWRCLMNVFDFNCVVVLVLSVAAFLSAIFWVLPNRCGESGFDADESIKLSATVQAYFNLQRPASELVPYIARLEYDINEEIGVPFFKVAVLSMHQAGVSNWTNVVFGFCSNASNKPISPVSENLLELKEQLRIGLQLVPTEVVCIQATNKHGSTKDPPVTIEASVLSDIGTLQPARLKQLAQRITESPSIENLGLDHSVFGEVKEISLPSFLNHSLYAPTPTPSPSPSPAPPTEKIYNVSPSLAPSHSPVLSTGHNCYSSVPSDASPTPAPSSNNAPCVSLSTPNPPTPSLDPAYSEPPLATPESYFSPSVSPLPSDSYAVLGLDKWSVESLVSSSHFSSSFASSLSSGTMWKRICRFYSTGVLTLVLTLWTS